MLAGAIAAALATVIALRPARLARLRLRPA
jgi:hypothetical protein